MIHKIERNFCLIWAWEVTSWLAGRLEAECARGRPRNTAGRPHPCRMSSKHWPQDCLLVSDLCASISLWGQHLVLVPVSTPWPCSADAGIEWRSAPSGKLCLVEGTPDRGIPSTLHSRLDLQWVERWQVLKIFDFSCILNNIMLSGTIGLFGKCRHSL
jgi:hypothetical protein